MRRGAAFATALLLSQVLLGADCVDGKTPDCSDAAAQCGPDLDGGDASDTSVPVPDAPSEAAPDAAGDAAEDAADASDEN